MWIPFCFTLLGALITGGIYKASKAGPTSDWAVKGQPVIERWIDKQEWFLQGSLPGAIIGLIIGVILYQVFFKKNDENSH